MNRQHIRFHWSDTYPTKEALFLKIVNNVRYVSETGYKMFPAQFDRNKSWFNILHTENLKYVYPVFTFHNRIDILRYDLMRRFNIENL